jgi:hypothetical protein
VFAVAGYYRGATQLVGLVVGTVLAILIAPALGRGLETLVSSLSGASGLTARFLSIALAGAAIITLVSVAIGVAMRRLVRARPAWKSRDRSAGAALGSIEGLLVAMLLLWVPLALEPVARAAASSSDPAAAPDPVTQRILSAAAGVRSSTIGSLAAATNPVEGSELLGMASDFATISRDEKAMDRFMRTDVMQKIQSMPSVNEAIDMLERDPELRKLYEGGVSVDGIRRILDNPTVLKVMDSTRVIKDLTPLTGDLQKAIKESRSPDAPASSPRPAPK